MILPLADVSLAVRDLVGTVCYVLTLLLIVYVLIDLARNFSRGLPQPVIAFHRGLAQIFEPVLTPIRNALPDLGGLDFSPLIVIVVLQVIADLVK